MMLSQYTDHHVNSATIAGLRQTEIDVLTAHADGFDRRSDTAILDRASELRRVSFNQDGCFIVLADRCVAEGKPSVGVVFAHQWQITIGQAIRDLDLVCRV
jgi:hypothetical protein